MYSEQDVQRWTLRLKYPEEEKKEVVEEVEVDSEVEEKKRVTSRIKQEYNKYLSKTGKTREYADEEF